MIQSTSHPVPDIPDIPRILVVDDDDLVLESVQDILKTKYDVTATQSPLEALRILRRSPHEILLVDLMMDEMRGVDLIRASKQICPTLLVLVMTGYGSKEMAIESLREGAEDFLEKPLSPDIVLQSVDRAWKVLRQAMENRRLFAQLKLANEELQRANEELKAMASFADLVPTPMLRLGRSGQLLRYNAVAAQLMGEGELANRRLPEILPELAGVDVARCIEEGMVLTREVEIDQKDYQFLIRGVPDLDIAHVYGVDVTALKQAKERLFHSQRLEAIGKLAGGVAHDFNNMLTVILLGAQVLLDSEHSVALHDEIEQIKSVAERGSKLTRQLLAFSRREIIRPQNLQLNLIVGDMFRMLRRTVGEDIDIDSVLGADLPSVYIDQGQIEQAIVNLVVNARDAMPDGGKLTIETSVSELDEEMARRHVELPSGKYVVLSLSDTGCGMSPEVSGRIFEPFFTTKAPGEGSGMGLAMVYGTVKQAGGSISVYSEPGQGTTFKIYLPTTDAPAEHSRPVEQVLPRGQGETILLVEDDDDVREVTKDILATYGYRVIEARDGKTALKVEEAFNGPLHLLLTDVIMPGMSGKELVDRMKKKRPELNVLFVSGYTDNAIAHHGVLDAGVKYLQKPFSKSSILTKVWEVIHGAKTA